MRTPKPLAVTALDEWLKRAETEDLNFGANVALILFTGKVDLKLALEVGLSAVVGKPLPPT